MLKHSVWSQFSHGLRCLSQRFNFYNCYTWITDKEIKINKFKKELPSSFIKKRQLVSVDIASALFLDLVVLSVFATGSIANIHSLKKMNECEKSDTV